MAFPAAPRAIAYAAGLVIPVILSLMYFALVLVNWSAAEGGFDTLANVQLLFTSPALALAVWVHFLAFDLIIGAWQARDARARAIPHLWVIPCLALTFLFGPIGFLRYLALRTARATNSKAPA